MHRFSSSRRKTSTSSTGSSGSGCQSNPNTPDSRKAHYRLVVMGAARVGKTSIINRFLNESFQERYKPTVEELHRVQYEIHGMPLTLDILDTAGSYDFPAMRQLAIKTGDAFILVYSVDDEDSLEEIRRLHTKIAEVKMDDDIPIVIVANKADLDEDSKRVSRELVETTVNIEWGNGFVETSAKNDDNIVAVFKELLVQAKEDYALSPAVRRRRESSTDSLKKRKGSNSSASGKRNSCSVS